MGQFDIEQAKIEVYPPGYGSFRDSRRGRGKIKRLNAERRKKRIWGCRAALAVIAFLLGMAAACVAGEWFREEFPYRGYCIGSSGVVHNDGCKYYTEKPLRNCQYCGGMEPK